jgi:predicted metal-dependent HD superfamily phosphohydrolase
MTAKFSYTDRWANAWTALGATQVDEALCGELIARYNESHRSYHTLRHLDECLERLDEARSLAQHPSEIEIALWFHDAIYEPRRSDNEERSAEWAWESAKAGSVSIEVCDRIRDLVLITHHHAAPKTDDEALMIDIDLAILGASPLRFDEYQRAIREEYKWVPRLVFEIKRRSILQQFLERERIYHTKYFADRFEQQARTNLTS